MTTPSSANRRPRLAPDQPETHFRRLLDAVQDTSISLLDARGHVVTWSEGARRMKGYEADEIVGTHFSVFFCPEDVAKGKPEKILRAASADGQHEEDGIRVRKGGERFWAHAVVTPLRSEAGDVTGFAKVTRDLTDKKRAEELAHRVMSEQIARAAAEASEQAEEASRMKDEFLATVSHELRTPLNAILGWSSLLRGRGADPAFSKAIEVIYKNARAQGKIIEDILDVSRIVTGKLRLETRPTSLVAVVHEAIEVVRPSAAAHGISISFRPTGDRFWILADAERLQQVVWNLLSNAVKFSDPGGEIAVGLTRGPAGVTLAVRDTGRGIAGEFLPRVFDRFRQADSSTTRRVGGLGLGLSLARHIVELHGGTVRAESEGKDRGSTFSLTLPVRSAIRTPEHMEAIASDAWKETSKAFASLHEVRILVVDDEGDARDLLQAVLAGAGAIVETAKSAADAMAALERFRPQLLVSDIGMPDVDGLELMRRVRSLRADQGGAIPAVALTAYARDEDRSRALGAGFTTHIGKPVSAEELLSAVTNLAAFIR